jgi:D-alanine-D-alanine ligase
MRQACVRSWELFELTGYARIDFRVTPQGEPLVLEINTNPGIAPDAGFAAAAARAGMSYDELVARIVDGAAARSSTFAGHAIPARLG